MGEKLTAEQKKKMAIMKKFMKPSIYENKPDNVMCKKHGDTPSMVYKVHDVEKIKVCFMCYAEKQTQGLKNFIK
jgi:hypothetical protein